MMAADNYLLFATFVILQSLYFTASTQIRTTIGSTATFHLPSFRACGQYNLTDYNRVNVIRVLDPTRTEISSYYKSRSSSRVLDNGTVVFTLNRVTCDDEGTYECMSPNQDLPTCLVYFSLILTTNCNSYWNSWMSWSTCGTTCGPGTRERIRTCSRQNGCSRLGPSRDVEPCSNNPPCVQYEWGMWNPWGPCSSTCGSGIHYRGRMCLDSQSQHVDKQLCQGDESERKSCTIRSCVEPLSDWATWSPWSGCSVTCGEGNTRRTRACQPRNRQPCKGDESETSPCRNLPCVVTDPPQTNDWSRWSAWSECSTTCGSGRKYRTRTCRATRRGQKCEGTGLEEIACRDRQCIVSEPPNREASAQWSRWQKWGRCSHTCGDGVQIRQRQCLDLHSRVATGRCGNETGSEEKRKCFIQTCNEEIPESSANPSQTQQGEAIVSVPLSGVVGIVAGLSILILLCVIIVLVRRLRKKRSVVMNTIGGSNQPHERESPRRNPSVFITDDGRSESHAYAEIDEDTMYFKTKKSMSVVTIDNTYVTLPTSASMWSGSDGGEMDSADAVGYCNVNDSVFRFDGLIGGKPADDSKLPSSANENMSSGLANQNTPWLTNEKKGQGRGDGRVPVDDQGYMVPVATPERKRQVKYTKQK